jgi:hypothetical protein
MRGVTVKVRVAIVTTCLLFLAGYSYCGTSNITIKNTGSAKSVKAAAPEANNGSAQKNSQYAVEDKAAPETAIQASNTVPSDPTYYSDPNKALLNPNVRYAEAPGAGAQEGPGLMQEKRLRLKLAVDEAYDSNIFLTKDSPDYDLITKISPGVYGYIGNDQYTALGFYEADVLIYSKHPKQTHVDQAMGGRMELFKQSKVKISLNDTLRLTTDPATSESTPFVRRASNNFDGTVRYDMSPKTSASFEYGLGNEYYISSGYKQFNYFQQTFAPRIWYHITPKTSLTGTFTLGATHYTGSADYDSLYYQGTAGVVGVLTPKSTIGLDAGYQARDYDSATIKNTGGFVMKCMYDYTWSPKTSIQLILSSDINESVYSDVGYFKSYNFYTNIKHHLFYNLDLDLNGLYIRSDYPHETQVAGLGWAKRSDNIFGIGGGLQYRFRTWLSAYAAYNLRSNISDIKVYNYNDNIVRGGIKLDF